MPIPKNATRSEVFSDFRHGRTYAKTRKKYGKRRARAQMIAVAMRYKQDRKGRRARRRG